MVIGSLARAGQRKEAEGLLATMQERGVPPDTVTFSSLIVPSSKTQRPSQAADWLDAMRGAGLTPDLLCYNKVRSPALSA